MYSTIQKKKEKSEKKTQKETENRKRQLVTTSLRGKRKESGKET